jgi:hypothetical protein
MFDLTLLHMSDAFALLGTDLVLCAGLFVLLHAMGFAESRPGWVKALTVLGFALLWIPLGEAQLPAVAYVRGITSDLSITLIALAAWSIGHLLLDWPAMSKREQMMVLAVIALAALFLYPLALGWGDWDLYQPGWGSWGMLLALLLICLACWANGLWVLPTLVALAMIAWSLDLMESGNLWDYLLDPWLSAFALGRVFIKSLQFALRRFR